MERDTLLDAAWHRKRPESSAAAIACLGRDQLDNNERPASERSLYDRLHKLTQIQLFFGDFAIARFDDFERANTIFLTFFKTSFGWRVAGETSISEVFGRRASHYDAETAHDAVLKALEVYYSGVRDAEIAKLDDVLHPQIWHMKNLEDSALYCEDQPTFLKRVKDHGPYPNYCDDRQIADVQVLLDRLALVRIDQPRSQIVCVFTFYNFGGRWRMVDKAFSWNQQRRAAGMARE